MDLLNEKDDLENYFLLSLSLIIVKKTVSLIYSFLSKIYYQA
jgi:hypothetical protein